jgi:hypothetical protein
LDRVAIKRRLGGFKKPEGRMQIIARTGLFVIKRVGFDNAIICEVDGPRSVALIAHEADKFLAGLDIAVQCGDAALDALCSTYKPQMEGDNGGS